MTHASLYGFFYRGMYFLTCGGFHCGNEYLLLNQQYVQDDIKEMLARFTKAELCAMLDTVISENGIDVDAITAPEEYYEIAYDYKLIPYVKTPSVAAVVAIPPVTLEIKKELLDKYCTKWLREDWEMHGLDKCIGYLHRHKFLDVFEKCRVFKVPGGQSVKDYFFKHNDNYIDPTTVQLINLDKDVYEYFDGYWYEYDNRKSEKEEYHKGLQCYEADDPEFMKKYFAGLTHENLRIPLFVGGFFGEHAAA